MTISFAGLSIFSLQNPFTELASLVVGKGDIRTMVCLLVFCIVLLVLAYLTNPSENSFRAYLTEQSFRQHLSRFDENSDDVTNKPGEGASRVPPSRSANPLTSHILPFDGTSPFHFANRASISLRTPKHVFHSFGIFTVAAMIPLPKSPIRDDRNSLMISDSWYIGAFGKWWRGGVLETWYQDVISRSKDEESWSSGILSMKSLDMLQDFAGPVAKLGLSGGFVNGSPPKLRNRERASCKNLVVAPRSSSPPPLPKSASLPLHTTRVLPIASERPVTLGSHHPPTQQPQQCNVSEPTSVGTPSRTPSTIFDQSPRLALVLEQISASKASIVDLRALLLDCQTSTSQTHASLQEELNTCRERKRIEDASKLETKSRTKSLEDSKRSAEGLKREADKRLRTAQTAHDHTTQRIQLLDQEMEQLQEQTRADEESLQRSTDEVASAEHDLSDEVEYKKQEIKNTEDILTALNQRVRELEEQLQEEHGKLRNKQSLVETRKAKRAQALARGSSWASVHNGFTDSSNVVVLESTGQPQFDGFTAYRPHLTLNNTLSTSDSTSSIGSDQASAVPMPFGHAGVGYSLAGFEDEVSRTLGLSVASPTGQSLIPSGLITSLDGPDSLGTSRSFQSDNDPYLEKEWRNKSVSFQSQGHERLYDPFCASPSAIAPSSTFPPSKRSSLDGHGYPGVYESGNGSMEEREFGRWSIESNGHQQHHKASTRRWFPTLPKDKSKKGLNPDAKEFSMALAPPTINSSSKATHHSLPSFDNLNPTGIGGSSSMSTSMTTAATTSESLFLRAFAPSPAEREALQRALGGANTSFERLPSLSDVGSIPSSPSHIHALPMPIAPPNAHVHGHGRGGGANKLQLPSWLSAFPRGRKTQFSPWGEEEPAMTSTGN